MMADRWKAVLLMDKVTDVCRRRSQCKEQRPAVDFNPTAFNQRLPIQRRLFPFCVREHARGGVSVRETGNANAGMITSASRWSSSSARWVLEPFQKTI
jgi:hypothetical protein